MGRGSYTASDWTKLRSSFGNEHRAEKIFSSACSQQSSLAGVYREARDNEDSPQSTPVIIGFDVTTSMGYLAEELALNSLNDNVSVRAQAYSVSAGDVLRDRRLQVRQAPATGDAVRERHTHHQTAHKSLP